MLSSQELYDTYTNSTCYDSYITNTGSDNPIGTKTAYGTPYDLPRLISFLRHLKYPCVDMDKYVTQEPSDSFPSGIKGTGADKLGLPYKFLNLIDAEAFTEVQSSINDGTAHAIRNTCDLSRACEIEFSKEYYRWESRMSTEYLQRFANNSLPDCLLMLGPDLVSELTATTLQMPGCSYKEDNIQYSFGCISNPPFGAAGALFSCMTSPGEKTPKCKSCEECDPDYPYTPCCQANTCVEKAELCCKAPRTSRLDFQYLVPSDDSYFAGNITSGFIDKIFKHIGIIKRKNYGGYGNFIDYGGSNFYGCRDDVFLKYFQSINNYNYKTDKNILPTDENYISIQNSIDRCKTISLISNTSASTRTNTVKDLLYNGYGVLLMTNVGFPNSRDSTGLSYPDRIWYHCYSIIAYDDTKIEFPECVYLLANSWGDWNTGGSPSWGPIPPGSFLITENHLQKITEFNHSPSFINCKSKTCLDALYKGIDTLPYTGLSLDREAIRTTADLAGIFAVIGAISSNFSNTVLSSRVENNESPCNTDPFIKQQYAGCTDEGSCVPFECSPYQKAFGLLFGLSLKQGFPKQILDYKQFYPVNKSSPSIGLYLDT